MTEHEKHCADRCPVCGGDQRIGYNDVDFGGPVDGPTEYVFFRFRCGRCGNEYVERYRYDATWYETED